MPGSRGRNATTNAARHKSDCRGSKGVSRQVSRANNQRGGRKANPNLDSGDDESADARLVNRAQGPEHALQASDRSKGSGKSFRPVKGQKSRSSPRVQDLDSSNSDSSSADTSSASESSALSISPTPNPYDGKADQLVFDGWKSSVEAWAKANKFSKEAVMSHFPKLVTGDAETCFFECVAPTSFSRDWEPKKVFKTLHKNCFPVDYKMQVHRELVSAKQGNLRVRDFARRITRLAEHVPYPVEERLLVTIFYEGLNCHIKANLILHGSSPGKVSLNDMIQRASHWEDCLYRAQMERTAARW